MTEIKNPKLEDIMVLDHILSSNCDQKICVSDHSSTKTDSFVVDMERFSHLIEKEINANSRITLQRNFSRKGSARNGEAKITSNERDINMLATSPRATLHGSSTLEKPAVVSVGPTDHSNVHHQITITNGSATSNAVGPTESKCVSRKFSFRRSHPTWTSDPRRILLFFATLSSMGTILLIYFTLSMGKLNGDDNPSNI